MSLRAEVSFECVCTSAGVSVRFILFSSVHARTAPINLFRIIDISIFSNEMILLWNVVITKICYIVVMWNICYENSWKLFERSRRGIQFLCFHFVPPTKRKIQSEKFRGTCMRRTCARPSVTQSCNKGVYDFKDGTKMNGNMVRPFHKRGRAWKAVVRWYWPVEPSDTRPRWCATFSLRYTRKEDRICYDTKLFETRSPREGFNILTGVFRPPPPPSYVSLHIFPVPIVLYDRAWYNRSWHFSVSEILLQTYTCFLAMLPETRCFLSFLLLSNNVSHVHTMRERVAQKLKTPVRFAPIEVTYGYFVAESDTRFFSPPSTFFREFDGDQYNRGSFYSRFTKIEAREFRKMRVLTAN